jgi:iron complex transport system substrate-binding protein
MRGAVFFGCLAVWIWTAHAATLADARGHAVKLDKPAARIVSLAPHVTELVYAAGAGERLVAAVDFSDYPAAAKQLPRLGNASHVDIERIVTLAPDLVIGWKTGNNPGDIDKLEQLGIPVYVTETGTLSQIASEIENIGDLAGTQPIASETAADFRRRLDELRRRYAGREPVRVFYQIWERPLMTINDRHFIADSIRLCGGRNVFAAIEPIAPAVSVEAVIAADPQVIVSSASNEEGDSRLAAWRRWKTITAVRLGNLFTIPPDVIERPTPRILGGVTQLCELLDRARIQLK